MRPSEPSRTAVGVAALRAAHQLIDGEPKLLDDPVVLRLIDADVLDRIRAHPERLHTPFMAALRTHVVVRSRYAEDRAREAAARGVRQYVSLGAGLDTFACRQPTWRRHCGSSRSTSRRRRPTSANGCAAPPSPSPTT